MCERIVGTNEEAVMSIIGTIREKLSNLSKHFTVEALCGDGADRFIDEALKVTGRGEQRQSPLQPKLMMWLTLCLSIFRHESIPAVLARLLTGLRDFVDALPLRPVDDDALAHARKRLGVDPVREFFRRLASTIIPPATFHGLCVYALDGTQLTMPDTRENRKIFGRVKTSRGRAAFPQLKMVALQDVFSHRFRDVTLRRWKTPERAMALPLLRHLGDGDLVLLDRGFYAAWFFGALRAQRSHFLARVPAFVKFRAIRGTNKKSGDYLAWIEGYTGHHLPEKIQGPHGRPRVHQRIGTLVRVIHYHVRGFKPVRLVTSLLDREIPALDLALKYHDRWEIELALDELKTHQSSTAQGTLKTVFRSQRPRNVMQEAFALVAAYNLIRGAMTQAAARHAVDPKLLSFVDSVRAIEHMLPRMRAALINRLCALHDQLLLDLVRSLIDRPRRHRRYARVVKVKMSNFKLKRPHHREKHFDIRERIRIGA